MAKISIAKSTAEGAPAERRDSFDLTGRTAFVTGGLGLIGREICAGLRAAGATTVALEPDAPATGPEDVTVAPFDAARFEGFGDSLAALEDAHGPARIWINCAYPRTDDWAQSRQEPFDAEAWRRNVDLQMNAVCALSAAVAERMAARGEGSLVNSASIYGVVAPDFAIYEGTDMGTPPAYSAIKGGIIAYTRYLAAHFGPRGVRVNALCPGGVANAQPRSFADAYSARTALKRLAAADEIAGPAVFLASDAASYVTGATLMVDGGLTAL